VVDSGGVALGCTGDVRSRADVERSLARCERKLGPIDICLNNAGVFPSSHILGLSEAEWDEVIGVNLTGMFRVAQGVARSMVARRSGVILNTSSSGAIAGEPGHAHYEASKAGILALTRAMSHDLQPYGVRTCALCPGQVNTYKWDNLELQRLYEARIAIGRSAEPEEVASVHLYLASDDAAHLNGAAFIVDGGMLAWE
jgi:NAD(P)-dependent dehydrogenase (short-subunit alcohol dehydrogenase family)